MPVLTAPASPTHHLEGTAFTSLATPSRGSSDLSVWSVEIAPQTPSTPHSLTREEVFVVLGGRAAVRIDQELTIAHRGDAIVVPSGARFELANDGDSTLRLLCCMPVGGQAQLPDGSVITPPWAQ